MQSAVQLQKWMNREEEKRKRLAHVNKKEAGRGKVEVNAEPVLENYYDDLCLLCAAVLPVIQLNILLTWAAKS